MFHSMSSAIAEKTQRYPDGSEWGSRYGDQQIGNSADFCEGEGVCLEGEP